MIYIFKQGALDTCGKYHISCLFLSMPQMCTNANFKFFPLSVFVRLLALKLVEYSQPSLFPTSTCCFHINILWFSEQIRSLAFSVSLILLLLEQFQILMASKLYNEQKCLYNFSFVNFVNFPQHKEWKSILNFANTDL